MSEDSVNKILIRLAVIEKLLEGQGEDKKRLNRLEIAVVGLGVLWGATNAPQLIAAITAK